MKNQNVKPGDIVAIPLDNLGVSVGIVLHVSSIFKNAMLVGYYKVLFPSVEDVKLDELSGDFIFTPNYTGVMLVKKGFWKVVGHSPTLLSRSVIPTLRVATTLYYKDDIVGHVDMDKIDLYPKYGGEGKLYVENKLQSYFEKSALSAE